MSNIPQNSKFLFSAMRKLSTQDTIDFFVSLGVALKTERGKRVFPESDKAADIRDALYKRAVENGTEFIFDTV